MTSTYLKMEDYPPIVSQLSKIFTIMSHPIFSKCCGVTIISLPIDFGWLVVCLGSMPRLFSLALDKYRLVFYLISFWSKLWDISPCAQKNALGLLDLLNTSYGPIKTLKQIATEMNLRELRNFTLGVGINTCSPS